MILQISSFAKEKVGNSILLTGAARSGTTIIGKVLHSFDRVEYVFEPPMLVSMFPLIEQMPKEQWCLLCETYLYEDFFVNAISGRSINTNKVDDSSIYKVKSEDDIKWRMERSIGKVEAELLGAERRIAFKVPSVIPFVSILQQYYTGMAVVIMRRDAVGNINSLLAKKWFADDNANRNMIWPFRLQNGKQIPFWVREEDEKRWLSMSELDRCAYYYVRVNEDIDGIANRIEIRYGDLLNDPARVVGSLADRLGLEFGERTASIIASIRPTIKKRDDRLIPMIAEDLRARVEKYSAESI